MTSAPTADPRGGPDLTGLHDLLWSVRRDPDLRDRLTDEPAAVAVEFQVDPAIVTVVARRDVTRMYKLGVNPYLLFFAALALGVDRAAYYDALRAGESGG